MQIANKNKSANSGKQIMKGNNTSNGQAEKQQHQSQQQQSEVIMPTPRSQTDVLVWDDEDIVLEEGHSRNKL